MGEEVVDFKKSTEMIYQLMENDVIDDDFEKMNESTLSQIYQSFENEIQGNDKKHLSALNQQVVDQVQSLEDEGMVDSQFRTVYLMKKNGAPSFFRNLVFLFFHEACAAIHNIFATLESSTVVDFDFLNLQGTTLKGSSGCFGVCSVHNVCCVFLEAVAKNSKDECLQAARNLNQAYHEFHTKLITLMKLEKKIVAAEKKALGQQ